MRSKLADHRSCLDELPSRKKPRRFRATSPRTCRDPSGSIDLDPSDLPGLRNNVHVMFSSSSGSSNAGCSIAWARNGAASLIQWGGAAYPNASSTQPAQAQVRFRGEADMTRRARLVGSVENDPKPT